MWYYIKCYCGHSEWIALTGKFKDREKKIAWLKNHDCSECRAKQYKYEKEKEWNNPDRPLIIRGYYWNGKFYGKDNNVIYRAKYNEDGVKMILTEEQIKELKDWQEAEKMKELEKRRN